MSRPPPEDEEGTSEKIEAAKPKEGQKIDFQSKANADNNANNCKC